MKCACDSTFLQSECLIIDSQLVSYIFITWSRASEHVMPDQSQGSESTVFQVDRTVSGSSYMPSFKVLRAETAKSRIPSKNRLQDINNHNNLV